MGQRCAERGAAKHCKSNELEIGKCLPGREPADFLDRKRPEETRSGYSTVFGYSFMRLHLGVGGSAVANGFFGEVGLLADAVGDFGEFTLVGTNGREVIDLPDKIERAEGFPDLFVAGIDGGDFSAGGHA